MSNDLFFYSQVAEVKTRVDGRIYMMETEHITTKYGKRQVLRGLYDE